MNMTDYHALLKKMKAADALYICAEVPDLSWTGLDIGDPLYLISYTKDKVKFRTKHGKRIIMNVSSMLSWGLTTEITDERILAYKLRKKVMGAINPDFDPDALPG